MRPVKYRKEKPRPEISNGSFVPNFTSDKPGLRCVAYNKDGKWRVFINTKCNSKFSTTECFLWNQLLQIKVQLPYLPDAPESFSKCAVTCFTVFPRLRMLGRGVCRYRVFFFHKNSPSYVWCSHRTDSWREETYADDSEWIFHDAIYFDTSSVDEDPLKLCSITILGTFFGLGQVDILSPYTSLIYERRLVPYYGEKRDRLFVLVRKPLCVWEVWEIDTEQQSYVSVANLEGIAVFLSGNYSMAYSCPEGNSIWFTEDGDDENFYVFSLVDQSLSIIKTFPGSFPDINDSGRPCFSFTKENQQKNAIIEELEENAAIEKEPEENANESMRLYSDKSCGLATIYHEFPLDLQTYIAESLRSVEDYANFRLVCRKWREIARPLRWKPDFSSRASIKSPWLMIHEKDSCFSFVDPTCNMRYYHDNINELMGYKVRYSKDGWLIVTQERSIFFFEPFSKTKISLADLPENFHIDAVCFSSSPQSSDWVVVAILSRRDRLRVMYLRSVNTQWDFVEHEMEATFFSSGSNPVFHDHKFYYLGRNGRLVAFWWEMFTYRFSIVATDGSIEPLSDYRRGYLVSCEDDLHLVVVGPLGKFINMYKLNVDTSKWIQVEKLEKFSLFISQTSSLALPISERSQQSTINLPLFVEDRHLSCKLGVSEFRCHDGRREVYKSKEFINGTWLQPKVIRDYR